MRYIRHAHEHGLKLLVHLCYLVVQLLYPCAQLLHFGHQGGGVFARLLHGGDFGGALVALCLELLHLLHHLAALCVQLQKGGDVRALIAALAHGFHQRLGILTNAFYIQHFSFLLNANFAKVAKGHLCELYSRFASRCARLYIRSGA